MVAPLKKPEDGERKSKNLYLAEKHRNIIAKHKAKCGTEGDVVAIALELYDGQGGQIIHSLQQQVNVLLPEVARLKALEAEFSKSFAKSIDRIEAATDFMHKILSPQGKPYSQMTRAEQKFFDECLDKHSELVILAKGQKPDSAGVIKGLLAHAMRQSRVGIDEIDEECTEEFAATVVPLIMALNSTTDPAQPPNGARNLLKAMSLNMETPRWNQLDTVGAASFPNWPGLAKVCA